HLVFLPLGQHRLLHGRQVGQARPRLPGDLGFEDRLKGYIALGLFRQDGLFLGGIIVERAAAEKGIQPVIVLLLVGVDQRVIGALGAVEVHPQEEPADVLGDQVGLGLAVQVEPGGGAGLGVAAVGREDFADQLVVGFILGEGGAQKFLPLGGRDNLGGP